MESRAGLAQRTGRPARRERRDDAMEATNTGRRLIPDGKPAGFIGTRTGMADG
ncbi:hypothetical protein BCEP4_530024 [Burkholderia cepacia]|nr:hypothetical protein BCEP4_530024 [Burkholderia cepacia]